MVKGDAELKIFHSMLKYNDLFVAQNISGNVIAFMLDRPLEGRPWILKILRDMPWAWPEVKLLSNPIEDDLPNRLLRYQRKEIKKTQEQKQEHYTECLWEKILF